MKKELIAEVLFKFEQAAYDYKDIECLSATRRHPQAQSPGSPAIWKTNSGNVSSSFTTPNTNIAGSLPLTF